MSAEVNKYRIYCNTESDYVYTWGTVEPTTCPNNNTHSINTSLTTIVETISTSTIRAEENSDGYFETSHIVMSILSGTPGAITQHDVTWPMNVTLWRTLITPNTDMIGDSLSVLAAPETTVGVITPTSVNIGDTTFTVNSTVISNIQRGFLVTLTDGVHKDVLGRCKAINALAGTISVENATTHSFAAGSAVQISIYVLKDIYLSDTNTIEIGTKGFKGKSVPAGLILRVYYTNNSGTAKIVRWRPEIYNLG